MLLHAAGTDNPAVQSCVVGFDIEAKVDELQRHHLDSHPEVAELLTGLQWRFGGGDMTPPGR